MREFENQIKMPKGTKSSKIEKYILNNYTDQSVAQMAKNLGLKKSNIYYYTRKHNLQLHFKSVQVPKTQEVEKVIIKSKWSNGIVRPPAEYTNIPTPFGLADELYGRNLKKQY